MKTSYRLCGLAFAALFLFTVGCQQGTTTGTSGPTPASTTPEYDFKAKVVEVAPDKQSVKLDHEAIPALDMMAMTMSFRAQSSRVLEGIKAGDRVKGRLKKAGDGYVVTSLQKQ